MNINFIWETSRIQNYINYNNIELPDLTIIKSNKTFKHNIIIILKLFKKNFI